MKPPKPQNLEPSQTDDVVSIAVAAPPAWKSGDTIRLATGEDFIVSEVLSSTTFVLRLTWRGKIKRLWSEIKAACRKLLG